MDYKAKIQATKDKLALKKEADAQTTLLVEKLSKLINYPSVTIDSKDFNNKLSKLVEYVDKMTSNAIKIQDKQSKDTEQSLKYLTDNFKIPELKPIVVPAPIVNVESQDLTSITMAIDSLKDSGIDLSNYRACDIRNEDDTQYIGFENQDGKWYIIESKRNKLRYIFGNDNYAKAFIKAPSFKYELLSEAINAL